MKEAEQVIERAESPSAARAWLAEHRGERSVGFVPTMGALHAGHLELVRRARRENDLVVVSIFVNPLQFDDANDLERYPRDFEGDAAQLEAAGCDLVFTGELLGPRGFFPEAPNAEAIAERAPGPGADGLEGALRPGHFEGVATIVARLFEVVEPTRAYFGQKDFQQTRVVLGLGAACDIVVCRIEREAHGLARSSRNALLADDVRQAARVFLHALEWGATLFRTGLRDSAQLERGMAAWFVDHAPDGFELEYTAVRDPLAWSAEAPPTLPGRGVALIAGRVPGAAGGVVRLIDNLLLHEVAERPALGGGAGGPAERPRTAELTLLAPAKVNPWLHVLARRTDGYHEVDLGLQAIDLVDHLHVRLDDVQFADRTAQGGLRIAFDVRGPAATDDVPRDASNLAHRAAQELLAASAPPCSGTLHLTLDKHIPSRAGLGGGSSDAAAARVAVERVLAWLGGQPGDREARAAALAALGSDTVFFGVSPGPARATGRGEVLEPMRADDPAFAPGARLLVVTPALECPTGAVFAAWAQGAPAARNALQAAAERAVPGLADTAAALAAALPGDWLLAGSGSSYVLALAPDVDGSTALAAARAAVPDARHIGLHRPFVGGFHGSALGLPSSSAEARA